MGNSRPRPTARWAGALVAAVLSGGARGAVVFQPVVQGLDRVTTIVATPALPADAFVAEQVGRVRLLENGSLRALPLLDIVDRVRSSGFEQGLTGLALPPGFPADRHVYVHYTRADNASVVARFQLFRGPLLQADPASETNVLTLAQPDPVHNCNQLAFGPDGYLYVGCGDGGPTSGPVFDPRLLANWYGKILRIDVADRPAGGYSVPADNPYVTTPGAAPEVWASGLRNPYRFSFDADTGDLWIGDVGQSSWEEVDLVPKDAAFGLDFGWNRMEGRHCYPGNVVCDRSGLTLPVLEYSHANGCAIIGGPRLRRSGVTSLNDAYLYADFCSGEVYAAWPKDVGEYPTTLLGVLPQSPTAIGVGAQGELWIGSYGVGDAKIYRVLQTDPIFADAFGDEKKS